MDYTNACYVSGNTHAREYVMCQGPMTSTIAHFWQMVWEQKSDAIVMLTNLRESGRPKCDQYWPRAPGVSEAYGVYSVEYKSEHQEDCCIVRHFVVTVRDATPRAVVQFHFTQWPDHGVPANTQAMLSLRRLVAEHRQLSPPSGPLVVHCSAGVGRSGTFVALDRLLERLDARSDDLDVFALVAAMRAERFWAVQADVQYLFIHHCLRDAVEQKLSTLVGSRSASGNNLARLTSSDARPAAAASSPSPTKVVVLSQSTLLSPATGVVTRTAGSLTEALTPRRSTGVVSRSTASFDA